MKVNTLGLKLVTFLAKHQMRATIEVNSEEGKEFIFRFVSRDKFAFDLAGYLYIARYASDYLGSSSPVSGHSKAPAIHTINMRIPANLRPGALRQSFNSI